jgi:predicted RND superfamily exporter protein
VAEDERASAVMAWMSARPDVERERSRIVREVREAAAAELRPSGREPKLAGTGVLYDGLNELTIRDTGIFLSLALFVMVAILAFGLRSVRAVAVAVVAALLSAGVGMGIVGLSGRPVHGCGLGAARR